MCRAELSGNKGHAELSPLIILNWRSIRSMFHLLKRLIEQEKRTEIFVAALVWHSNKTGWKAKGLNKVTDVLDVSWDLQVALIHLPNNFEYLRQRVCLTLGWIDHK
jgi:hypothetical protein